MDDLVEIFPPLQVLFTNNLGAIEIFTESEGMQRGRGEVAFFLISFFSAFFF